MGKNKSTQKLLILKEGNKVEPIKNTNFKKINKNEPSDLHPWIIENPEDILLEDIKIIDNEYTNFDNVRKQPDILGVDKGGRLVIVEVKRDRAPKTTNLQAIEYAGYCSSITSIQVQYAYQRFREEYHDEDLDDTDVGERFVEHIDESENEPTLNENGWAEFTVDNKPRIILVAKSFPIEVTSPVMWLRQEYGLDISCISLKPHKHEGNILLTSRIIIPIPEAENYMEGITEKKWEQESSSRRRNTVRVLFERGVLKENDIIKFNKDNRYLDKNDLDEYEEDSDIWKARVIEKSGYDNFEWLYDNSEHSASSMAEAVIKEVTGKDVNLNGAKYWYHPRIQNKTLVDIRNKGFDHSDRQSR